MRLLIQCVIVTDYLDFTAHSYCKTAFARSADQLIANAEMQLLGQGIDFDSMVGIGNSGLLVMPILARHFDVPFFAMRKPGILHHNSKNTDGDGIIGRKWILVDDVKVTGSTIRYANQVIRKLTEERNFTTTYIGTYFYEPMSMSPGEFMYAIGTCRSVQSVTVADETRYVSYGEYSKVQEIFTRLATAGDDVLESTVAAVMKSYPKWDEDTVRFIARSLTN